MGIKLEYGKRYVDRVGRVTGPLVRSALESFQFCSTVEGANGGAVCSWTDDGYFSLRNRPTDNDLVAEYTEVPVGRRDIEAHEQAPVQRWRWLWCKPDRAGLWAFSGVSRHSTPDGFEFVKVIREARILEVVLGWWCRIGDVPVIDPPKTIVVKRMWICASPRTAMLLDDQDIHCPNPLEAFHVQWIPDGQDCPAAGWIRTDNMKEFSE